MVFKLVGFLNFGFRGGQDPEKLQTLFHFKNICAWSTVRPLIPKPEMERDYVQNYKCSGQRHLQIYLLNEGSRFTSVMGVFFAFDSFGIGSVGLLSKMKKIYLLKK